jgi:FixJ family two-component response regulator
MSESRVHIVDDDNDVRDATALLIETAGYNATAHANADSLLASITPDGGGCLVLDVRLPGMNGLELQRELAQRGIRMPIVFITGHGDVPMAVQALNEGAFDFLEKPLDDDALLDRVEKAVAQDADRRAREAAQANVEEHLDRLTPRERQVMEGMLAGKLNKVIGHELDMSTRTVEVHRARVLDKLGVRNASEMVRYVLTSPRYRDWLGD